MKAQTRESIPLQPGVTQVGNVLVACGNYFYTTTNFGANIYRYNGTIWENTSSLGYVVISEKHQGFKFLREMLEI